MKERGEGMLVIEREVVVQIEELKNGTHAAGGSALILVDSGGSIPAPCGGGAGHSPIEPVSAHGGGE